MAPLLSAECLTARRALGPYRDGELPAGERAQVEAHLGACSGCSAALADAQALGGLLRLRAEVVGEELPPDFSARVMAALPAESGWSRFWRTRRPWLIGLLAAGVAAAAVVGPLVFGDHNGRASSAPENEAHIHRLAVQSPGAQPLVFQNDLGETVVWVVPDEATGGEAPGATPDKANLPPGQPVH